MYFRTNEIRNTLASFEDRDSSTTTKSIKFKSEKKNVSFSDNQGSHRRQINERRDHENTSLFTHDATSSHPHTKYGTSPLL